MAWFESTWALMNLSLSVLPSTLLGTLPVGIALYQSGSLSPSELAICLILSMGIVGPLMKFTTFVNDAKAMEYSVRDADRLLNLPELPDAGKRASLAGFDVELRDVSFSYGKKDADVLQNVGIWLPEGSFSALVGPSGSGKTTVARLIARFWDVTGGSISIGGRDIREIPLSQLSGLISFVTQDSFLFNCPLRENIRLGNPKATDEEVYAAARAAQCDAFIRTLENGYDTSAGEAGKRLSGGERRRIAIARAILKDAPIVLLDLVAIFAAMPVFAAAKAARCHDFILGLPDGYDTVVGEGGSSLSGGERQRISIARAILKDAPIVILDEVTASVDPENERYIQQAISALTHGKTVIIIAHRLATIQNVNQILVMDKGRIVQWGTHRELMGQEGIYRRFLAIRQAAEGWSIESP